MSGAAAVILNIILGYSSFLVLALAIAMAIEWMRRHRMLGMSTAAVIFGELPTWCNTSGSGYGDGYGYGYGFGLGDGYSYGYGLGDGYGYGDGYGQAYGYSNGAGYGVALEPSNGI